jgi:hypothetical protein
MAAISSKNSAIREQKSSGAISVTPRFCKDLYFIIFEYLGTYALKLAQEGLSSKNKHEIFDIAIVWSRTEAAQMTYSRFFLHLTTYLSPSPLASRELLPTLKEDLPIRKKGLFLWEFFTKNKKALTTFIRDQPSFAYCLPKSNSFFLTQPVEDSQSVLITLDFFKYFGIAPSGDQLWLAECDQMDTPFFLYSLPSKM